MSAFRNAVTMRNLAIVASCLVVILFGVILFLVNDVPKTEEISPAPTPTVTESEAPAPEPTVEPEPEPTIPTVVYEDCSQVWEELGRPITNEDEGYPATTPNKFDLDSDGIGCEDNPATEEDESSIDWKAIWDKTKHNAKDFGNWASDELENLWRDISPWLKETASRAVDFWN